MTSVPDRATVAGRPVQLLPQRAWPLLALRGVLAIVLGIVALTRADSTPLALASIVGAYVLINGVVLLVDAFQHPDRPHRGARIAGGLLGVIAAAFLWLWPGITALALAAVVGAWAVTTGICEIAAAIRYRGPIRGEFLLALSALASMAAGITLLVWPGIGVGAIAFILGVYGLIIGIMLIALALRLRHLTTITT
jgi:uncharacterized membrane protein HdeD (DUF308 family)